MITRNLNRNFNFNLNHDLEILTHTFAQILAAETQGYNESAFLATVMLRLGKIPSSLAWNS